MKMFSTALPKIEKKYLSMPLCSPLNVGFQVILDKLVTHIRAPALLACTTYLIWPLWIQLVAWADISDVAMFVAGTTIVHFTTWFVSAFVFVFLGDRCGYFKSHQLPRPAHIVPRDDLLLSTIKTALVDQLITSPIAFWVLLTHVNPSAVASQSMPRPSLLAMYLYYVGSMLFSGAYFYVAHRTLHEVPFLYRTIHKKHHQYIGTVAIAAEHAHPLEALFANSVSTVGFALVVGVPLPVWFVWLASRLQETYETHSGYCFERTRLARIGLLNSQRAKFHNFHLAVNVGNYGGPMADWVGGSMGPWIKSNNGCVF